MQNEVVWDLLLELWQPLHQSVVLKLMCCSRSMMELVHSKCPGMLPLKVSAVHTSSSPPAVLTSWPQHHALGRWLAKHATLCSSIHINIRQQTLPQVEGQPPSMQQAAAAFDVLNAVVAAGLTAAAGGCPSHAPLKHTGKQAASAPGLYPATPGAKAAAAFVVAASAAASADLLAGSSSSSSSSSSKRRCALPLTGFASSMPNSAKVLLALAGCTQLTRLELQLSDRKAPGVRVRAALASLTSLVELTLVQSVGLCSNIGMSISLDVLHPAFQSLTGLTYCSFSGIPEQRFVDVLPVGLVRLDLGSQLLPGHDHNHGRQLAHLTQLTELHMPVLLADDVLPPFLCSLACDLPHSVQPLLSLIHLECLSFKRQHSIFGLEQLPTVTRVTRLTLSCCPGTARHYLAMPQLPPLRQLTVQTWGQPVADQRVAPVDRRDCLPISGLGLTLGGVGMVQHLTCLVLQDLQLVHPVQGMRSQLKMLPALQELSLVRVYAPPWGHGSSREHSWGSLLSGVAELVSLRSFIGQKLRLCGAAASLAAATQLTHCELVGCRVSEAAEAELREGLRHLGSKLVVL